MPNSKSVASEFVARITCFPESVSQASEEAENAERFRGFKVEEAKREAIRQKWIQDKKEEILQGFVKKLQDRNSHPWIHQDYCDLFSSWGADGEVVLKLVRDELNSFVYGFVAHLTRLPGQTKTPPFCLRVFCPPGLIDINKKS